METTFQIREAIPADRPTLVRFMTELQEFERTLHPNRSRGDLIGSDHLAYLEQMVREHQGKIFVAERADALLGFIVGFLEELDDGDLHLLPPERRFACLSDLYVIPQARAGGIGKALIHAAEAHFQALGVATVRITVLHKNFPAQQAYLRAGYAAYEVTYEKRL